MAVRTNDHAVVLGASMAGLLAARVLSEHYQRVTLIERDELPATGQHRKGVPHGRHLHGLHPRGREILEELFPGFTDRLTDAGAVCCDILANLRWQLSGHQLRQEHADLPALLASRPFFEGHVRELVQALPQVSIVERGTVAGLEATSDRRRITGVLVDDAEGQRTTLTADIVVDASGRGSRTPLWLGEFGYQPPTQDKVEVGLGYATRNYRLRPGALNGDLGIMTAGTPDNPRTGVLAAIEHGRHILTLAGICGDHPPTDPAGFAEFISSLRTTDISAALAGAEPLDDNAVPFRFPASTRNRYEQLREFPDGLLVIGDAVCSFNPVYGQGMTVAAAEALELRRFLASGADGKPQRFFAAITPVINVPWDTAVGGDLAFPQVPGARTAKVRFINAYMPKLVAAAERDGELAISFVRVVGMKDRPEGLLRPDRVLRVLRGNLRRTAKLAPAPSPDRESVADGVETR